MNRENKILKYMPLTKFISNRMASKMPVNVNEDDLYTAGLIGLIDAVDKFDDSKGAKFKTYAEIRIRGSILDECRESDWLKRGKRHSIKKVIQARKNVQQKLGKQATLQEVADHMGITLTEITQLENDAVCCQVRELEGMYNTTGGNAEGYKYFMQDIKSPNPLKETLLKETKDIIKEALTRLSPRESVLCSMYYSEGLTFRQVGENLGLTESRVCQIHNKILSKLRTNLRNTL